MRVDCRALVEAAYAPKQKNADWLTGLARAARGSSLSTFAYLYDATGSHVALGDCVQDGEHPPHDVWWPLIRDSINALPRRQAMLFLQPRRAVMSLRRAFAQGLLKGNGALELAEAQGMRGISLVVCSDPTAKGVVLGYADLTPRELSPHTIAGLTRAAAHVAAARRLREGDGEAELILDPEGKVEHAISTAEPFIAAVVQSVVKRERARQMQQIPELEALELWRAMTQGQWTLVDQIDRDGKRYVLARRNTVAGPLPDRLSRAEQQVVAFAMHGHSYKYIAYELGISPSSVASRLASAMRKIGVKTPRQLIQRMRGLP